MLWRYPNRTALEPGVRLLPEVLKKAGYQTCHIGKWHVTENPLQNGWILIELGIISDILKVTFLLTEWKSGKMVRKESF